MTNKFDHTKLGRITQEFLATVKDEASAGVFGEAMDTLLDMTNVVLDSAIKRIETQNATIAEQQARIDELERALAVAPSNEGIRILNRLRERLSLTCPECSANTYGGGEQCSHFAHRRFPETLNTRVVLDIVCDREDAVDPRHA